MKRNTLIFDLDGTIANTAPDLIGTLNRIIQPFDVKPASMDNVGQIVGQGAKAMISRAFELDNKALEKPVHDQLFQEFLEDYSSNIANETHVFPGLLQSLHTLESQGYRFCVCTNKLEDLAKQLLGKLDLVDRFPIVTGGDTFDFRKPDPRHLSETVRLMERNLDSAIMIGDSSTDINAAKYAGIPSIAVTFGYSDSPVETLGATAIISDYDQLSEKLSVVAQ